MTPIRITCLWEFRVLLWWLIILPYFFNIGPASSDLRFHHNFWGLLLFGKIGILQDSVFIENYWSTFSFWRFWYPSFSSCYSSSSSFSRASFASWPNRRLWLYHLVLPKIPNYPYGDVPKFALTPWFLLKLISMI